MNLVPITNARVFVLYERKEDVALILSLLSFSGFIVKSMRFGSQAISTILSFRPDFLITSPASVRIDIETRAVEYLVGETIAELIGRGRPNLKIIFYVEKSQGKPYISFRSLQNYSLLRMPVRSLGDIQEAMGLRN